jgi:predicted HicB family RNase H-like nuclease
MDLTPFVESLRRDLAAAAAAGSEETRRTASLLTAALEPAARLAILDALSTATADVTAALDGVTVEVRMNGREPRISVDMHLADTEPEPESSAPPVDETDGTARITLRLPESIKARTEEAANRAGISVNSWLVRAVTRALDGPPPTRGGAPGRRLVGYARG